jgi:general L-amino acid transport system substrate-binding protein
MIVAEELGVTSLNIDEMKNSENPKIKRLIGIEGRHGEDLYLDQEWSYRIIKQVGNYGESYERNLGYLLPERGPNNLWKNGGFIFVGDFR